MSTDKTLSDVQPGGRVRLGDQEFAQGCDELRMRTDAERSAYLEGVAEGRRAALSAQPSRGGHDAAIEAMAESLLCAESSATLKDAREQAALLLADALPHLTARQPVAVPLASPGKGEWSDGWNACREAMLRGEGEALAARQPVGEPVTVEAVATVRRNGDGDRYIDWLMEGGIADLEVGDVLIVSDRAITDEDGSGEVYAAPRSQAVDLGQFRDAITREYANSRALCDMPRILECESLLALIDSQAVGK